MNGLVVMIALAHLAWAGPPSRKANAPSADAVIRAALPKPLRALKPGLSKAADVRKTLGAPAESEKDLWRFDLGGGKFDTTIQFEKGVVSTIYHRFGRPPGGQLLEYSALEEAGLTGRDAGDPAEAEKRPHDVGREREALYASSGIRLRFKLNQRRTVTSVVLIRPNKR